MKSVYLSLDFVRVINFKTDSLFFSSSAVCQLEYLLQISRRYSTRLCTAAAMVVICSSSTPQIGQYIFISPLVFLSVHPFIRPASAIPLTHGEVQDEPSDSEIHHSHTFSRHNTIICCVLRVWVELNWYAPRMDCLTVRTTTRRTNRMGLFEYTFSAS